jgi:hypothetical protein
MGTSGEPSAGERAIYHRPAGPRGMRELGTVALMPGGQIELQLDSGTEAVPWDPPRTHLESGWDACPECRRQEALKIGAGGI